MSQEKVYVKLLATPAKGKIRLFPALFASALIKKKIAIKATENEIEAFKKLKAKAEKTRLAKAKKAKKK